MDKQRINALLEEHLFERKPDPHRPGFFLDGKFSSPARNVLSWAGMGIVEGKMWEKKFFYEMRRNKEEFTATFENREGYGFGHDKEAPVAAGVAALRALNVEVE